MSQASFNDSATSVVKAIQDGVETQIVTVDGKDYTSRPVYLPPTKPDVSALQISTLDGLIEYINENADKHNFTDLIIVVNSPRSVSVRSQVESKKDSRVEWLAADYEVDSFPFDRYIDHEQFMVKAQALICETDDQRNLLKFVGNLTTALVQTSTDDGKSQTVVVETGVRKSEVDLPNPVNLAPRRTFPEVEQPGSPFVLRLKQSREGQLPEIALFEADGGLWRVEAITNIKTYIARKLNEDIQSEIPIIG